MLRRPFQSLIFDWDGTAVVNRLVDATEVAQELEQLLDRGVWTVIVTGTNFGHLERQLVPLIAPIRRARLVACVNRGSEVYGFDRRGLQVRRFARIASPAEEQLLTTVAEAVRDELHARTGLEISIVSDRLNRRKVDLIPLREWADPPKSAIGELQDAVEARLQGAGLSGGIQAAFALAQRLAADLGLKDARITSDVKHLEIGLTDKSDSLDWIKRQILDRHGIPLENVLVAGDEFGPVAGFPGSDDLLRSGVQGSVAVSVGPEPNGVPPGIIHLGGGPARFQELLREQVQLWNAASGQPSHLSNERQSTRTVQPSDRGNGPDLHPRPEGEGADRTIGARVSASPKGERSSREPSPPTVQEELWSLFRLRSSRPEWRIERVGYRPETEPQIESHLTVSNGFLGTRGSLEWPMPTSRPRTYVAGLFDVAVTEPPVPTLYPGPNWLSLRWTLDAEMISPGRGELSFQNRVLDMRNGVLWTEWRQQDIEGRTLRVRTLRLVSLAARRVAVQAAEFAVDQSARVTLEAWLDGERTGLVAGRTTSEVATWRTHTSGQHLAVGSSSVLRSGERRMRPTTPLRGGTRRQRWAWNATPGQPVTFTRLVTFIREEADNPSLQALEALRAARRGGVRRLIEAHTNAWEERWAASDVQVDGDPEALRALRFSIYHLIAAANPEDEHVSIGARGLTGDAYRGHVFWDTEIFLLPFYTYTWPEAARALLMYRYHTLPAARAKAEQYGFRGAFYPWESAGQGEEATPPYVIDANQRAVVIYNAEREVHISADVAHAVWEYWQTTADDSFLVEAGAEILLETARFWASRATLEEDGRYHLRTVIGPDEYHDLVHDNAYTNVMAQWNIERALEALDFVAQRFPTQATVLRDRLGLAEQELDQWRTVSTGLVTGYDPTTGLFEQFEGFFDLKPVFAAGFSERTVPLDVLLGPETTRRSQVVKQADVVMLMALLQDRFPARTIEANFRFYEARSGHGSSLSPPMHALVAARLGDVATAQRYFRQSAAVDLDDLMGNASLGVHMATLGGLWQVAVFGFAGLSRVADGLRLSPRLPSGWDSLTFRVQWHGTEVEIELRRAPALLTVTHLRGNALTIHLDATALPLRPGESWAYGSAEI